jgi:hypothetical protein
VINPLFVAIDLAVVALAMRSLRIVGMRGPFTTAGWVLVACYGLAGAVRYALPTFSELAAKVMIGALAGFAVAFVAAGARDERQAEPWFWPRRLGQTRAERTRSST